MSAGLDWLRATKAPCACCGKEGQVWVETARDSHRFVARCTVHAEIPPGVFERTVGPADREVQR